MRSMKRVRLLTATAVLALTTAAVAVADAGPASTTQVTATFYATTPVATHSQTCSGANNDTFQLTHATFTGSASSSDAHLNGPATVDVSSVIDTTKNLGWLTGDLRVATTSTTPAQFHAHFTAVDVNGTAQGFLNGDGGGVHLLGSFSGTFSVTGGFGSSTTPVSIGTGGATNTALLTSGGCMAPVVHPMPPHPGKHIHITVDLHHGH